MNEPVRKAEELPAVGSPVERGVGRLVPDRAAYDAWYAAATFETMGNEWTWAAWRAAVAHERAQRDPERDDFLAGICVALQCVTASDDGVLWREIVQTAGVESLLRYATFVEPDEWDLAGFKRYAQREMHRSRPRKCVPSLKTPNAEVTGLGRNRSNDD